MYNFTVSVFIAPVKDVSSSDDIDDDATLIIVGDLVLIALEPDGERDLDDGDGRRGEFEWDLKDLRRDAAFIRVSDASDTLFARDRDWWTYCLGSNLFVGDVIVILGSLGRLPVWNTAGNICLFFFLV